MYGLPDRGEVKGGRGKGGGREEGERKEEEGGGRREEGGGPRVTKTRAPQQQTHPLLTQLVGYRWGRAGRKVRRGV